MSNIVEYKDIIAFHPGSYIEDIVEDLNITQQEFAARLGMSAETINKIINCESPVSDEIAFKLQKLTGISVETWMNLQNSFNSKKMEIDKKIYKAFLKKSEFILAL